MDFDEDPDYLDLDDILAQSQTVNCRFLLDIPGLEFLSPDSSQEAAQGNEVLLPFWMAKTLFTYSMIDIDLPKFYNAKNREVLEVDPQQVNLHRAGPYYYKFGQLLMGLRREKGNNLAAYTEEGQRNKFRREEGETLEDRRSIATSLLNTFHNRRHMVLEYSTNRKRVDLKEVTLFESRLDNLERRLYSLGRQQVEEIDRWNSRKIELICNSKIAARLSKRRKLEMSSSSWAKT